MWEMATPSVSPSADEAYSSCSGALTKTRRMPAPMPGKAKASASGFALGPSVIAASPAPLTVTRWGTSLHCAIHAGAPPATRLNVRNVLRVGGRLTGLRAKGIAWETLTDRLAPRQD